jgi:hypothetical protein
MRFFTMAALAALAALAPLQAQAGGYGGLYRGIVTSSDDPAGRHRLRIRVPDVAGSAELWAVPSAPYGSAVAAPPVGSTVWIMFEEGDASHPVWIGWLPASGGGLDPRTGPHAPSSLIRPH